MTRTFTLVKRVVAIVIGASALFVLISLLPIRGNYTFRVVLSGSMEPAIETGSVIATIPRAEYRVGEIVTFGGSGIPTTHRIVGTEEGENGEQLFVTKGDANEEEDFRRVSGSEVLGKVFLTVPKAGHALSMLESPTGKALLITALVLLVALSFVPKGTFRQTKKQDADTLEE